MARIRDEEFLARIKERAYNRLTLRGLQDGTFCLLLECADACFILENQDGSVKSYRSLPNVLDWLKRKTGVTEVVVDLALWKQDQL